MTVDVTVLTASIPERAHMLGAGVASVASQTHAAAAHHISIDLHHAGAAPTYNGLLRRVETEWVTFLDDDDRLYPHHLATLVAAVSDDVDVVYAGCDFEGAPAWHPFYNIPFDGAMLRRRSLVPITAMVRTDLALGVGGMPETRAYDYDFWKLLLDAGARFLSLHDERTWVYVRHFANQSFGELPWTRERVS